MISALGSDSMEASRGCRQPLRQKLMAKRRRKTVAYGTVFPLLPVAVKAGIKFFSGTFLFRTKDNQAMGGFSRCQTTKI
jgi:hypothetical protein